MFPKVFSELGRRLFPAAPVGNIPLRAYGKLAFDPEFLKVGCDDQPAAQSFVNWVSAGFDRCERVFGRGGFEVCPSQAVLSADGGKTWIVACIWPSHDRTSEHGTGRAFPFTLFGILPALALSRQVPPALPSVGVALWRELYALHEPIVCVDGREAFVRGVRARNLPLPAPDGNEKTGGALAQAAEIDFREWIHAAVEGDFPVDVLVSGLQRALLELRSSKPRNTTAWLLPATGTAALAPQIAVWMEWLTVNLGCTWSDFAILAPLEPRVLAYDLSIIARPLAAEDFSALLADRSQVAPSLGWPVRRGGDMAVGHENLTRIILAGLPTDAPRLADFARIRFPLPSGSWVGR